jgi:hypothetical protein
MTPEQAKTALAGDLPPVLLVAGPGAAKLVFEASLEHRWTRWWFDLTAASAREIIAEAWLVPESPRVTALNMDGASIQVQNMLLKVLEEPPPGNSFVLAASGPLLDTVLSRCQVLRAGAGPEEAAVPDSRDVLAVGGAVRAARAGNSVQLAQMVREWSPARAQLLVQWAAEAAAGRWKVFAETAVPGVRPEQALRLLQELAVRAGSRLAPVVALQASFPAE